jgi:hypothetical protein
VSPGALANENNQPIKFQAPARGSIEMTAAIASTHRAPLAGLEPVQEDDAAEIGIEETFRRMLMGLRRLPRRERAAALRAAREWRMIALKAAREKRAGQRHARYVTWKLQMPAPR